MQEQDIITKTYWADNERFADIINVGMFQGEKVLSADKLEEKDSNSVAHSKQLKKKNGIQKRRDVLKQDCYLGFCNERMMSKQWKHMQKLMKKNFKMFFAVYVTLPKL